MALHEVPKRNAITGTRAAWHKRTIAATSSFVWGNTTTSGSRRRPAPLVAVLIARRTRRLRALAVIGHKPGHEVGDIVRVSAARFRQACSWQSSAETRQSGCARLPWCTCILPNSAPTATAWERPCRD